MTETMIKHGQKCTGCVDAFGGDDRLWLLAGPGVPTNDGTYRPIKIERARLDLDRFTRRGKPNVPGQ